MSDEDRIARVARALCVLDGLDPDAGIPVGSLDQGSLEDGTPLTVNFVAPGWTVREVEARRFVTMAMAMGLLV